MSEAVARILTVLPAIWVRRDNWCMPINLREADRDQLFLLPPSVADWLPENHLAFFVLDVVSELDLDAFYGEYREDGRGGAAYDPALVLAVLVYAYCVGERSSTTHRAPARRRRRLPGRGCEPATRPRHSRPVPPAARRGDRRVVRPGARTVRKGGTRRLQGDLDRRHQDRGERLGVGNRTRRQLADEILAEAERQDTEEDERFGESRGDELPPNWARREDRRARVREALRQLDEQGAADYESYLAERAARERATGHKLPGRKPTPGGKTGKERFANPTDPDSRMLRARNRFLQGYNAQAAVSTDQVIVAAEVTNAANDSTMFVKMVRASEENLAAAEGDGIGTFVADTGYWSVENVTIATPSGVLITPMPATKGIADPDDPRIQERSKSAQPHRRRDAQLERGRNRDGCLLQLGTPAARRLPGWTR